MQLRPLNLAAAAAAALCLAGSAHAAVVNFDAPGLITIDPITSVATYTEAGYKIQGQAAEFLLLDNGAGNGFLVGGFFGASPLSLMAATGGAFSLLGLDLAFFDLGDPAGTLTISGLLNGNQVATSIFNLGGLNTATFGAAWAQLTQVNFQATSGFSLDNINVTAVPEPGTLALVGLAVAGLAITRRRAGQQSPMKPPPAATAM
jgi:hypothetical protein